MSAKAKIAANEAAARSGSEFEVVYRANLASVTVFFARRCSDPQTVADLTAETFVAAISSFPA